MRMRLEGLMGSKAKFSQRIDVPGTADTPENLQGGVLLVFPPGFGPTLSPGLDASAQALERQIFLALAGASPQDRWIGALRFRSC